MRQRNKAIAFLLIVLGISSSTVSAQTDTNQILQNSEARVDQTNQINLQLVDIPAGTFKMGSPEYEINRTSEETQFKVTLSAFRMSKCEITNEQFAAFLNEKNISGDGIYAAGSYPKEVLICASSGRFDWGLHYREGKWVPVIGCEKNPVINVTWYGAMEFAAYVGGTLPTEAQWEYACRAGTKTPFNSGNNLGNNNANYDWTHPYNSDVNTVIKSPGKTLPVGSFPANAYGLCDMHGNVWEWTKDLYGKYPTKAQVDYSGPAQGETISGMGPLRILRGGSWNNYAFWCRSASRRINPSTYNANILGFRVVLTSK
jgi:formylglycine-generating enzyme